MKRDMPGAFIRESSMHDRKGGEDMAEIIHHPETENHAAGWNEHAEKQEVMDLRRAIEESRWLEIDIRSRTEQMISLREAADRMSSALPGIRSGAGGRHDFMERAVVSMVDLEESPGRRLRTFWAAACIRCIAGTARLCASWNKCRLRKAKMHRENREIVDRKKEDPYNAVSKSTGY